jgi:RHS repeat-associated protein
MPNESTNIPNNIRYAYTSPNDSVSKVDYSGTSGQTTGPSLLLKVMAGDTITPSVQCYYVSNTLTTTNSSLNSVLSSLASGILGTPTGAAEGNLSGYTSSSGPVFGALSSFLTTKDPGPPAGYPKAYLNWILLDDQFNYVSGSSGSVATASTTYPANQMNLVAPGGPIVMGRNGYLYVWVSNETQGWDVFFDDFAVQYKQGPLLEENHYYPYGLTMAGISDKALKTQYATNKYRYNGKELQNQEFSDGTGLEEYDYGARLQDPQLGVWHNIDPHAENSRKWSPYTYAYDNPIKYIDPDGMDNVVETAGGFNYTSSLAAWNDKREEDVKNVSGTIGGINAFIQQKAEDAAANALQQDPDDGSVENGDGGQSGPGDGGILKKALVTAAVVEVDGGGPLDVPADLIAGGIILGAYAHVLYNEAVTDDGAPDVNAPRAGKITDAPIYIPPQDQIDRELLNSPAKPGNAPTFKKDGTSVEIHHEGQSMEGPYKEMHWRDHRGKGNDKINHPDKGNPSKILRKLWDKQREEYWRQQNFPPENPVT